MEQNYSVPNLERCLDIIEFLSKEKDDKTITEIARELDFPRNSVFRILKTLYNRGYMVSLSGKTYRLSSKLLSVGYAAVSEQNLLLNAARPMQELRDEVNETVFLGIIHGTEGVVLEEILSRNIVKVKVGVGTRFPVHTSAPGKAILAFLDDHRKEEIIKRLTFTRYTDTTIGSREEMERELAGIRKKGFATDHEEHIPGINCVACPVFNFKGEPAAAIWIGGQSFQLGPDKFEDLGKTVKRYARDISIKNGHVPEE